MFGNRITMSAVSTAMSASLILDIEQFSLRIQKIGVQQAHRTPFKLAEAQRQPTLEAGASEVHFSFSSI